MKSMELTLWQRTILYIGLNEGCNKWDVVRGLDSNFISVSETIDELIKVGRLKGTKDKGEYRLFVINTNLFNLINSIKHEIEMEKCTDVGVVKYEVKK